jgi:hypothetical protein
MGKSAAGPRMMGGSWSGNGGDRFGGNARWTAQADDGGAARVSRWALARSGANGALLDRVNQLVGENVAATDGTEGELAGAEHNVRSVRQGARVVKVREGLSGRPCVQTEGGEVEAEDRFEAVTQGGRKRRAGAQTSSGRGGGDDPASHGWAGGFIGR